MSQCYRRTSRNTFKRQIKLTWRLGFNLLFSPKKKSFSLPAFQWDVLLSIYGMFGMIRNPAFQIDLGEREDGTMDLTKSAFGDRVCVLCLLFFFCIWVGGGVGCMISCYQSTLETPLWLDIFEDWPGLPVRNHPNPRGGLFVSTADTNKQKYTWHFYLSYSWMGLYWLYVCNYVLS